MPDSVDRIRVEIRLQNDRDVTGTFMDRNRDAARRVLRETYGVGRETRWAR